uniref:Uncharacterized protein n=1 Tax=Panagrolaimus sp. JU765 TaxID=591449 RepID=A0AC34QL23_9BILA
MKEMNSGVILVILFGLLITVTYGFNFGIDKPIKYCEFKVCSYKMGCQWTNVTVRFDPNYTIWPIGCPFHNRITVECAGKINPDATIELYDLDDVSSDDLIATFTWNHIHEGKKKAYFDAFASARNLDESEPISQQEDEVELYFKLHDPCLDQQNKEFFIRNVVYNYTFIPEYF